MLSRSLPAKLSASYFHGFLSVQHAVSLPPNEALPKLFARFPVRPACCLAPSQRSSPQAICTVSSPSSMLSRSLPAKLSASYLHGFLSVQHAVSLPPSEALRKLFARLPVRPACCLAPSQRSFPLAICTNSSPSSMLSLSRSLPAKLSPSYLHGFLSVQHAVSLPPSEAFRKLFARFPIRPACCLAPSQRSSPQAICTVSSPSSMLSRSLPAKLPPSYLHGFLSVQHAVSLPPSEAFRKLFARFPIRPACLSRSLPVKLSPSYLHGFQSVQHAVSLPPSEALRKLFAPPLPSSLPSSLPSFSSPSLPSFLPSLPLPPSLPPFLPFLLSFLPSFFPSFPPPPPSSLPSFLPSFLLFPFLPPSLPPSSLPPSQLPPSLPPSLPSFLPSLPHPPFLPSFLLSFLPISVPSPSNTPYRSLATKCLNENPSIGDAFGKNASKLKATNSTKSETEKCLMVAQLSASTHILRLLD